MTIYGKPYAETTIPIEQIARYIQLYNEERMKELIRVADDLGVKDPDTELEGLTIQAIAKAIQNRTGISENRSIGAAEEVYHSVLVHLL